MIAKPNSESRAPKKNEPLKPAARCRISCVPETSHDCTWVAEMPVCACSQSLVRAIHGNCCKSAKVLMSHCLAALCSFCSNAEICETNSSDRALNGNRITSGVSSVNSPAAPPLPRRCRRQRTFKGNIRKARNAAQVTAPKIGEKIKMSA